ncbi:MAG: TolC family protein [Longimicrobiales bacterium]
MSSRTHVIVGVFAAAMALSSPLVAQQLAPAPGRPGDTVTVNLHAMVRLGVELNLRLRSQRLSGGLAESDLLAARASFDPEWSLSLDRSTTATSVVGDASYDSGVNSATASLDGYLPTSTSYSLGLSAADAYSRPLQGSVGAYPDNYSTGVSVRLRQPLLRGAGPRAATALVRSARSAWRAADEDVGRAVERTIASVEEAFWLLRYMEAAEEVARTSLERARQLHERNLALRARDLVTQLDVITAQRTVAIRETTFLDAQRQRVDAAEALMFLVYGDRAAEEVRASGSVVRTSGALPQPPALQSLEDLEASALSSRHDAAAARERLRSAEVLLELARSTLRPSLDLTFGADYGGLSDTFKPYSYPNEGNWKRTVLSFGAAFTLPQFNRSSRAGFDQATLLAQHAGLGVFLVENGIRAEIRAAARGVRLSVQSLASSEEVVRLAEEEYGIARRGLDLGQITTFQLFQYEADLVSARLARAYDEYQLATALSAYYLAAGGLGDRYGIEPPGSAAR